MVARGPLLTVYTNDNFVDEVADTQPTASTAGTFWIAAGGRVHLIIHAVRLFAVPSYLDAPDASGSSVVRFGDG